MKDKTLIRVSHETLYELFELKKYKIKNNLKVLESYSDVIERLIKKYKEEMREENEEKKKEIYG